MGDFTKDRPRPEKSTVINEEKIDEVRDFCEGNLGSSVHSVAHE